MNKTFDIYYEMSDEKLISNIHNGNKIAEDILINRYINFIDLKSKTYFITGGDREDIIQEGMIGLYKAMREFDINRHVKFSTFAHLCITHQIFTAIKTSNGKKHLPLNSSLSYNNTKNNKLLDNTEEFKKYKNQYNPEYIIIKKEYRNYMKDIIKNYLSNFEKEVIHLYIKGNSYSEISKITNKNEKSIDNAIQRSRKKIEKLFIVKINKNLK